MAKTSKEIIMESATKLLVNRGYNAFSFADISEDVELAKPTIHHHFPSKEDLVVEVLSQYRDQIKSGLQYLSTHKTNPIDRLKGYIHYWQECIESGDRPFCICVLLAAELPSLPKSIQKQVKMHFEELGDWIYTTIDEGKKLGSINVKGSVRFEADLFRAQVHGAMLASRALNDSQMFTSVTKHILSGLASDK